MIQLEIADLSSNFLNYSIAAVQVAQLVEGPFKGSSKRCNSLNDAGSNPGRGGEILAAPSIGEQGNKYHKLFGK